MFAISFTGDQWFLFVWLLVLILILGIKKKDTRRIPDPRKRIAQYRTLHGGVIVGGVLDVDRTTRPC
jgi:hypothetical protein